MRTAAHLQRDGGGVLGDEEVGEVEQKGDAPREQYEAPQVCRLHLAEPPLPERLVLGGWVRARVRVKVRARVRAGARARARVLVLVRGYAYA